MKLSRAVGAQSQLNIGKNYFHPAFAKRTLQSIENASMKDLGESAFEFYRGSPCRDCMFHRLDIPLYKSGGVTD